MSNRSKAFGRDYVPAWCEFSKFVSEDSGDEDEAVCCCYCGERATSTDHLVPYSWFTKTLGASLGHDLWTWTVPACQECNSIASDQMFPSPVAKRNYIQQRLRARYSHIFMEDGWTGEELEELDGRLKQYVRAMQASSETVRARVRYRGKLPTNHGSQSLVSTLQTLKLPA